jgi:hypothetical protein
MEGLLGEGEGEGGEEVVLEGSRRGGKGKEKVKEKGEEGEGQAVQEVQAGEREADDTISHEGTPAST